MKQNTYALRVPFFEGPKQTEGVEYEKVVVRIILPEGATDVRYQIGQGAVSIVSAELSHYRTFLDTVGRTVLTLTSANLVDEMRDGYIVVSFPHLLSSHLPIFDFSTFNLFIVDSFIIHHAFIPTCIQPPILFFLSFFSHIISYPLPSLFPIGFPPL